MAALRPLRLTTDRLPSDVAGENRPHSHVRIRIRIPKQYQREPIISNLITRHSLTVNIAAALLGANGREDGWFDLELHGSRAQIESALVYLNDLDLEIWHDTQEESW
ncbi:NIL domain-containing protein [Phormidium tenue FACHB-886]|nr:NIL domain-containing protein [Phormidium tenue FACHB-886]